MTYRRRFVRTAALCLVGAAVAPLPLAGQVAGRAAAAQAIDSVVAAYLTDGTAAGMSVAVVRGRDTLALKGYGFADLEHDVPTPARAVYEIGSITKQFTAVAMLQLQEQGKLSLDDDLAKHLPDYPTQGHRISLRRLLDHTSGIKGYTEIAGFGTMMTRKLPKDSLVALFRSESFDFAPGEAQVYNNSAYFLAGLIIEKVSGLSYEDYVRKHFFDVAGMPDSHYCSESALVKRKAHGYDMGPKGLRNKGYIDHTYPYAAGSLCSTVGDLVAWNRALHGGKILTPASYRELIAPGVLNDGTRLRYAKGLALHEMGGHRVIEHGGGIPGFLSSSVYLPEEDAIIVTLINTAGPVSPDAVSSSLAEVVFGTRTPRNVAYAGDLAALAGTYAGVGRGSAMTVHIAADKGALTVKSPRDTSAIPLRHVGDNTWDARGQRYTFVLANGKATTLRADMVYGYSFLSRQP